MPFVPSSDIRKQQSADLPAAKKKGRSGLVENILKPGRHAFLHYTTAAEHAEKGRDMEKVKMRANDLIQKGKVEGVDQVRNPYFQGEKRTIELEAGGEKIEVEPIGGGGIISDDLIQGLLGFDSVSGDQVNQELEKIRKINKQLPKNKRFDITRHDDLESRMKKKLERSQKGIEQFREREKTTLGSIASFASPMLVETAADPWDAATLGFGASAGSSILKVAATEAMIGGTTEAIQQPFVKEYRNKYGQEHTLSDSLKNILTVAVGSGALGGGLKGMVRGGDELAKRFRLKTPGYEKAGRMIAENLEDWPDNVVSSIKEGTMTSEKYAEAAKYLNGKGLLDPQQKAALKAREANKIIQRQNPFENKETPTIERGRLEHIENFDKARASVLSGRKPNITHEENPMPLRQNMPDYNRTEVDPQTIRLPEETDAPKMADMDEFQSIAREFQEQQFDNVDAIDDEVVDLANDMDEVEIKSKIDQLKEMKKQTADDATAKGIDEDLKKYNEAIKMKRKIEGPEEPILYRKENGEHLVLDGEEMLKIKQKGAGDSVKSIVVDGRHTDIEQARSWVAGRRSELDDWSSEEVAEVTGRSPEEIPDISQHPQVKEFKALLRLDDKAFREMVKEQVSTTKATMIANRVESPEAQRRAMKVVKTADDLGETEEIINQGIKRGFDEDEATEIVEEMRSVREAGLESLRRERRSLNIQGEDVNVGREAIEGIRELSKSRGPANRALRNGARKSAESGSRRSGVDEFLGQLEDEIERGNVSWEEIREKGAGGQAEPEIQPGLAGEAREPDELIQQVREGEYERLDEFEQDLRDSVGEEKLKEEDDMTINERLDQFDENENVINDLRGCF